MRYLYLLLLIYFGILSIGICDITIYGKTFTRAHRLDTGMTAIYIKNTGKDPVEITGVKMNGTLIPVYNLAHNPAPLPVNTYWAKLWQNPIPGNTITILQIKYSESSDLPVYYSIHTGKQHIDTICRRTPSDIELSPLRISTDMKHIYLLIHNHTDRDHKISGLEINGKRNGFTYSLYPETLIRTHPVLCEIDLNNPLTPGETIILKLTTTTGITAITHTTAYTVFPVNKEGGTINGYNLDPRPCTGGYIRRLFDREEFNLHIPSYKEHSHHIFSCPMHTFNSDIRKTAWTILIREHRIKEKDTQHPCLIHICRVSIERGLAIFGKITDTARYNPMVPNGEIYSPRNYTPVQIAEGLSRLAYNNIYRPVALINPRGINPGTYLTPKQLKNYIYTVISCGIQGIIYRYSGWRPGTEHQIKISREIMKINSTLQYLKPHLIIAQPYTTGATSNQYIKYHTLICTHNRILIIFISTDKWHNTYRIKATIPLCTWIKDIRVYYIENGKREEIHTYKYNNHKLELDLNLEQPSIYMVEGKK